MRSRPAPGTVLDSRPLPEEFRPGAAAAAFAVVYQGVGYDGAGRAVSGSVFLPAGEAPDGGWPVVGYAHGTTGLSDRCGPSRAGLARLEREHVSRWLAAGYAVAATDYEGLATPGPHPYFNGEAVADDVVDAVRAARGLDRRVGPAWLAVGFSQGGHAALFTGMVAGRYAPELDFRGTAALAPPVRLPSLVDALTARGDAPLGVLVPYLLAGLPTSHPDLDPAPFLTAVGRDLVDLAATAPLVEVFRAAAGVTNDAAGTTRLPSRPGIARVLRACRVPTTRMDRPVLVAAGAADEVVPIGVVERFVDDATRAGTPVRFLRHDGARHADVLGAGHQRVIAWADSLVRTTPRSVPGPLEADGDDYLTLDDYEVFALRLIQGFGEPPGSPAADAVRQGYRALWRAVATRSDTDDDGRVDEGEFRRWITRAARDDGFDLDIRPLAEAVVALADRDRDGVLSADELDHLLRACDTPSDPTRALLDHDRDGSVTVAELVATVRDFCLDPAPGAPGHWLFGRLRA